MAGGIASRSRCHQVSVRPQGNAPSSTPLTESQIPVFASSCLSWGGAKGGKMPVAARYSMSWSGRTRGFLKTRRLRRGSRYSPAFVVGSWLSRPRASPFRAMSTMRWIEEFAQASLSPMPAKPGSQEMGTGWPRSRTRICRLDQPGASGRPKVTNSVLEACDRVVRESRTVVGSLLSRACRGHDCAGGAGRRALGGGCPGAPPGSLRASSPAAPQPPNCAREEELLPTRKDRRFGCLRTPFRLGLLGLIVRF